MKMTFTVSDSLNLSSDHVTSASFCEPCPRATIELILGVLFAILIIISNLICIRVSYTNTSVHHPENKYFVLNLAICNLLCGFALLVSNGLDFLINRTPLMTQADISWICLVWCPIYKTCVMVPYVAVATLGFDIAFYCQYSMNYHRFMSNRLLSLMLAGSWLYTFVVVSTIMLSDSAVFCNKESFKMNPVNILFPILLMFLPATMLVSVFLFIICRHWRNSHTLTPHTLGHISTGPDLEDSQMPQTSATLQSHATMTKRSGSICTSSSRSRRRLIGRFIAKFLHLIICSIIFALIITFLTVAEVTVEDKDERYCMIFLLDRLFISFNSLLGPWIYCFAAKRYRKGIRRRLGSLLTTSRPLKRVMTSDFVTHSSRPC